MGANASSKSVGAPRRLAALLTAFNRRAGTLACLARLDAERPGALRDAGVEVGAVLVDDGGTDGTADAVRARFPWVKVVRGSGRLYWNGGMRRALEVAAQDDPDFFLLLNDDTHLLPGALARLVSTHDAHAPEAGGRCVVVGTTADPATGKRTYGGWRKGSRLSPLRLAPVEPGETAARCDTMNGNCVLLPRAVFRAVGNLEPTFTHRMGDLDYGLRASTAGCALWVAPGFAAECTHNPGTGLWVEGALTPGQIWTRLLGPKGLPPREWLLFTYRHYGPLWPAWFLWPYARNGARALRALLSPGRRG